MNDWLTVFRRLALWTAICTVSAAPSFVMAGGLDRHQRFNTDAMVFGVAVFIFLYTALTSTAAFERFHNRPFVRRTLYIGYAVRMGMSLAFPIGVGADIMPGIVSVRCVESLELNVRSFTGTFLITLVQG